MLLLLNCVYSAILASSKLQSCLQEDELNCSQKIIVSLSIENEQLLGTELIQFIVQNTTDSNGQNLHLAQPFALQLQKSQPRARYPIQYVQDFNNKPKELVVISDIFTCEDDEYSNNPSCNWRYDSNGDKIWNSQGFCCSCEWDQLLGLDTQDYTRAQECNNFNLGQGSATAHCLEFDDLWYSAYEIYGFSIFYNIGIQISQEQGQDIWMNISPENIVQISEDRQIIAKLVGDMYPNTPPPQFTDKFLFAPSRPIQHPRYVQGSRSWMFIRGDQITWDGSECNKIGTSYEAFRNENNKCEKKLQSCLGDQIDQFYQSDMEKILSGKNPDYLIQKYGDFQLVQENRIVYLDLMLTQRFSSLITIEIAADDIQFTTNLSTGEIDYAQIQSFEAVSDRGRGEAQISNTGNFTSQFILSYNCTEHIYPIPANTFSLHPNHSKTQYFDVFTSNEIEDIYYCNLTLLNTIGEIQDFEIAYFNTTSKITYNGAQGGQGDSGGEEFFKGDSDSTCQCTAWYDLPCFFIQGCWGQILAFFGIIILIVVIFITIRFLIRRYGMCCQKLCKQSV